MKSDPLREPLARWQAAIAARLVRPMARDGGGTGSPRWAGVWSGEVGSGEVGSGGVGSGEVGTAAGRAGWSVTVALYRQWRLFRLSSLAPLTLAVLGSQAPAVVDGYLAHDRGSTSYASRDAAGFLDYVRAHQPEDARLVQMATLEGAFLAARRPSSVEPRPGPGQVFRSDRATVAVVPFDVLALVRWACRDDPEPGPIPGGRAILVAPGVAGWVRDAGPAELTLWDRLGRCRDVRDPQVDDAAALGSLRAAGAVIVG